MQILVLYYSKSGNTLQLAEEIAKGVESVPGVQALLKSTQEVTKNDFTDSAGLIAGSPVYFGAMAADLKRVFDEFISLRKSKKMENKVGAAFTTSGDPTGGKETTLLSIIQCMFIYGMIVVGDPIDATGHYGTACVGAPDKETSENGFKLGARVASLCQKLAA